MSDTSGVVILVPAVLGVTLVVLGVSLALFLVWFARRKKLWCFARAERGTQPLQIQTAAEMEAKRQHKKRLRGFKGSKKIKGFNILDRKQSLKRSLLNDQDDGLQNPLVGNDEFDGDFSNPLFDVEAARTCDAATTIQSWWRMHRYHIPFLQLREATLLAQAIWRGKVCRRNFPELKKRRIQDQQRKKATGVFNKRGRLATPKFYDVKGFGFAEVEQLYGLETIREATSQLKKMYGGKGKMRLKVLISVKGIKLFDVFTLGHYATVKISSISFCTMDPKNKRVFAFINRKKKRNFCHVFQCQEGDALKMVETMAEAFEFTFRQQEKLQALMESQQMLAGAGTPLLGGRQVAEIPPGMVSSRLSMQSGSLFGSRETLASVGSRSITKQPRSIHGDPTTGITNKGSLNRPGRSTPENLRAKKHSGQFNGPMATTQTKPAQVEQQKLKTTATATATDQETSAQHDFLGDLQKAMDDLRTISS